MSAGETEPLEVHAIAGKILELVAQHVACSEEVLAAALKIAASTVEEAKFAQFGATLRANYFLQSRGKR